MKRYAGIAALFVIIVLSISLGVAQSDSIQPNPNAPAGSFDAQQVSIPNAVRIRPTDDALRIINDPANARATFQLAEGVYEWPMVTPKDGQRFVGMGADKTILTGARTLTGWQRDGSLWYVGGQTQRGIIPSAYVNMRDAMCSSSAPRCLYPEDLYFNNLLLRHEQSLADLGPGEWYFDYTRDRIYVFDNPAGQSVERTVTPHAFRGSADFVIISSLRVEKFSTPVMTGAIHADWGAEHWIIDSVDAQHNHSVGIRVTTESVVRRSRALYNGQWGIIATGEPNGFNAQAIRATGIVIENNEMAFNNYHAATTHRTGSFRTDWAGGGQFVLTRDLVVRGNYAHDNGGSGLRTSRDALNTHIYRNIAVHNTGSGILHETSRHARIEENSVKFNGLENSGTSARLAAQITLLNAAHVVVNANEVVVAPLYGEALTVRCSARGSGIEGEWRCEQAQIAGNQIVFLGNQGGSGILAEAHAAQTLAPTNTRFEANAYFMPASSRALPRFFASQQLNERMDWAAFQSSGFDVSSSLHSVIPSGAEAIPAWSGTTASVQTMNAAQPLITLEVVDPATRQTLGTLQNNGLIALSQFTNGTFTVVAVPSIQVSSVQFVLDNLPPRSENAPPYSLGSDNNGTFFPANVPLGEHTLTVNAYSQRSATGTLLATVTVRFTVVQNLPTPTPTATHTPTVTPTHLLVGGCGEQC